VKETERVCRSGSGCAPAISLSVSVSRVKLGHSNSAATRAHDVDPPAGKIAAESRVASSKRPSARYQRYQKALILENLPNATKWISLRARGCQRPACCLDRRLPCPDKPVGVATLAWS
jgi:hypothetical protein